MGVNFSNLVRVSFGVIFQPHFCWMGGRGCGWGPNLEASTSARKVSVKDIRWSPSSWASIFGSTSGMKNWNNTSLERIIQLWGILKKLYICAHKSIKVDRSLYRNYVCQSQVLCLNLEKEMGIFSNVQCESNQKDQAAVASAIPTAGDVDGRDRMAPSRMIPRVCWGFEDLILREMLLMAEILHQLIWKLSHYLQGFIHPWWWRISSINRYKLMGCILSLEGLESKLFDILDETPLSKQFSGFMLNFGGLVDSCRFKKHAAHRGSQNGTWHYSLENNCVNCCPIFLRSK